eukprot:s805_g8.t1
MAEFFRSQRLRQEEQKRRQAAVAERDQTQHELQQLVQSLRQEGGHIHPAKLRAASPLPSPKAQNVEILQATNGPKEVRGFGSSRGNER